MNDTAAPSLFGVPYKFDQWCMGCRRSEEEPNNLLYFTFQKNIFDEQVDISATSLFGPVPGETKLLVAGPGPALPISMNKSIIKKK